MPLENKTKYLRVAFFVGVAISVCMLGLLWWSGLLHTRYFHFSEIPTTTTVLATLESPTSAMVFMTNTSSASTAPTQNKLRTNTPHPTSTIASQQLVVLTSIPKGKIVFTCQISKMYEQNDICIMNADGSNSRQLTDNGANNFYPSLSPDGNSIVFASTQSGNWQIYEMNLKSGSYWQLTYTPGEANAPEISPDGKQIVYKCAQAVDTICVMNRDGSNPHSLINMTGWDPVWSPDGSKILYASGPSSQPQLYITDMEGSNIQQITNLVSLRGRSDWSEDNSVTTYAGIPWKRNIIVFNIDGSGLTQLTDGGNSQGPSFSPDGQWIAFTAYFDKMHDEDGCEIYIISVDGKNLTRLTNNEYCDWQPRWGP